MQTALHKLYFHSFDAISSTSKCCRYENGFKMEFKRTSMPNWTYVNYNSHRVGVVGCITIQLTALSYNHITRYLDTCEFRNPFGTLQNKLGRYILYVRMHHHMILALIQEDT